LKKGQSPAPGRDFFLPFLCASGACGLFFGLPNTLLHLPPLALLHPFCLYLLARLAPSNKSALLHGWLQGFAANAAGLYWMIHPMRDVADMPLPVVLPLLLLLYAYLACYAALTVLGMRHLHGRMEKRAAQDAGSAAPPSSLPSDPNIITLLLSPLLAGGLYGGFEVLNSVILTGFPWLTLSSAFAFTPLFLQGASLIGGYGLSASYACVACLGAAALCAGRETKPGPRFTPILPALPALLIAGGLYAYGSMRLDPAPNPLASRLPAPAAGAAAAATGAQNKAGLNFIMVQGNIDQGQKWTIPFQEKTVRLYSEMSQKALVEDRAKFPENPAALVIWPETAMPFYISKRPDLVRELSAFAVAHAVHLAFGGIDVSREEDGTASLRNCLYLMSPTGKIVGRYDKTHLVPFGEYLPFTADIPFLRDLLQGINFSSGRTPHPLFLDKGGGG
jgi:apolipoprotein N-acyltransferase